jgi:Ca2+/H+ antiporter, TMEM165/GDT1 family
MNLGVFATVFGSASVEFLETAAIAYAIARSGYPKEAIGGTIAGFTAVALTAAIVGKGLQVVPLHLLQLAIGLTLLWFGWGWYIKSIRRQASHKRAGWITEPLESEGIHLDHHPQRFNRWNFIVMCKSAALETLEVVLVMLPLGLASGAWNAEFVAAGLAIAITIGIVLILHGYLIKIPEVLLKLSAGILLLAYGTFWLGEGAGLEWQLGEWILLVWVGIYSLLSLLMIRQLRSRTA